MHQGNYQTIQVEEQDPISQIVLNKPPLNIIDLTMIQEIRSALEALEGTSTIRVIVLRGAGVKAFSAGVSVQDHTSARVGELIPAFDDLFRLLARTDKIIVGVVQGFCFGGGFELILASDLVIAAGNAQFAQPEIKLGQAAPIGLILLPYLIGYRNAAELLLTGKSISANEAQSLGLVNHVVPPDQLMPALQNLLGQLNAQSGAILRLTKHALRRLSLPNFEIVLKETEDFLLESVLRTKDANEGILAFLEKRAAQWTHS
jgi:cyclohexa-1,5-dienecarbonyl-CoA hydratase